MILRPKFGLMRILTPTPREGCDTATVKRLRYCARFQFPPLRGVRRGCKGQGVPHPCTSTPALRRGATTDFETGGLDHYISIPAPCVGCNMHRVPRHQNRLRCFNLRPSYGMRQRSYFLRIVTVLLLRFPSQFSILTSIWGVTRDQAEAARTLF